MTTKHKRKRHQQGLGVLSRLWSHDRSIYGMRRGPFDEVLILLATKLALLCAELEVERGALAYTMRRNIVYAIYYYFSHIGPYDPKEAVEFERTQRPILIKRFHHTVSKMWPSHKIMVIGLAQMDLLRQSRALWLCLFLGVPALTIYFLAKTGAWLAQGVQSVF